MARTGLDFTALPRWMPSVHFYDLEREWTKIVNDLQTRPQRVRVPFMVDDLPAEFVARPQEYEHLAKHLLDRSREEPIAITAALRGAGGFGKTALALALCHDETIQNAFDDGFLWVTLGEKPGDLTGRVEQGTRQAWPDLLRRQRPRRSPPGGGENAGLEPVPTERGAGATAPATTRCVCGTSRPAPRCATCSATRRRSAAVK